MLNSDRSRIFRLFPYNTLSTISRNACYFLLQFIINKLPINRRELLFRVLYKLHGGIHPGANGRFENNKHGPTRREAVFAQRNVGARADIDVAADSQVLVQLEPCHIESKNQAAHLRVRGAPARKTDQAAMDAGRDSQARRTGEAGHMQSAADLRERLADPSDLQSVPRAPREYRADLLLRAQKSGARIGGTIG